MSFSYVDDSNYYARFDQSQRLDGFEGTGLLYAMASAAALSAGAAVAKWLSSDADSWNVDQYNAFMSEMHETILAWDRIGWDRGCWNDISRRENWKVFMNAFGKHWSKGKATYYVSDSEEGIAKDLMRRLAAWGEELNKVCGLKPGPAPIHDTDPEKDEGPGAFDYLKWGAIGIGALLALNIVSAVKNVGR